MKYFITSLAIILSAIFASADNKYLLIYQNGEVTQSIDLDSIDYLEIVDDYNPGDEPGETMSVEGTWKVETMKIDDDWWQVDYCQFAEGGKYTNVTVVYFMGEYDIHPSTAVWLQNGNQITIDGDTGTLTNIDSNSMTISFNGIELHYKKSTAEEMNKYLNMK